MTFAIITLLSALSIAGVAAWYSIIGLSALFGAAVIPIIIMASTLEVGKLVSASWLYRNWHVAPKTLRTYLAIAVVGLMLITSMGIFGFLSKSHIEHVANSGGLAAKVERIVDLIDRENHLIKRANKKINDAQNQAVNTSTNTSERINELQGQINNAYERLKPAVKEQQGIIDRGDRVISEKLEPYENQLNNINSDLDQLERYIANDEIKKLQALVGEIADGKLGTRTAAAIREYKETILAEQTRLMFVITSIRNAERPEISVAIAEIKRLRGATELEVRGAKEAIDAIRGTITYIDHDAIERIVTEQSAIIKLSYLEVDNLTNEKFTIESALRKFEAEVGPLMYVAELVYGEDVKNNLDNAVRFVIMLLIFVFDPLAVCMVIAANMSLMRYWGKDDEGKTMPKVLKIFAEEQEKDEEVVIANSDEVKKKLDAVNNLVVNEKEETKEKIDIVEQLDISLIEEPDVTMDIHRAGVRTEEVTIDTEVPLEIEPTVEKKPKPVQKKILRKNPDIKSVQGIKNKRGGYHVIPGKDKIQTPNLTEEEIFTVAAKIRNKLERETYLKKNLGPNLAWNEKDTWRGRWHKFLQKHDELNDE
jgi:hypothetical protein